jgi:hypothetical protein
MELEEFFWLSISIEFRILVGHFTEGFWSWINLYYVAAATHHISWDWRAGQFLLHHVINALYTSTLHSNITTYSEVTTTLHKSTTNIYVQTNETLSSLDRLSFVVLVALFTSRFWVQFGITSDHSLLNTFGCERQCLPGTNRERCLTRHILNR